MLSLDNYVEIARWIDDGATWKSWLFTCRAFASMNTREKLLRLSDDLRTLLKLLPDGDWCALSLSMDRRIPWEEMKRLVVPRLEDWFYLSGNKIVTIETVRENLHLPWSIQGLSLNPNTTLAVVRDNPGINWDFSCLSRNPNITLDQIIDNPDLPWKYSFLSNPNLTVEKLREKRDVIKERFNVTFESMEEIVERREQRIDISVEISAEVYAEMRLLSSSTTIERVKENPDLEWDWWQLSANRSITWIDIVENQHLPWNYHGLSQR